MASAFGFDHAGTGNQEYRVIEPRLETAKLQIRTPSSLPDPVSDFGSTAGHGPVYGEPGLACRDVGGLRLIRMPVGRPDESP